MSTISWSSLAAAVRLLTGFVSIKFVAILIGPFGVALLGQFNNLNSIIMTIALGGISAGIVKYTSEFKDNQVELNKIWGTTICLSSITTIPVVVFILIFHQWLAIKFFHDVQYGDVFVIFACCLVFFVANSLLLNVLNGLHEVKKYNLLNTLNSVLGLFITISLVYYYKMYGALLALIVSQSITFCIIVLFVVKSKWFNFAAFFGKFDKYYFKKLMGFTLMSVTSMCVIPTSQMFIRTYLASHTSWEIAGCWQGMQRISDAYLMIVYMGLGTYYLPKLSNLRDVQQIRREISHGYKVVLPGVIAVAIILFFCKNVIINLLFAKTFMSMSGMFFWQLLGDCFKIATYFVSYLVLAKAKIKIYIVTEVIFGASYALLSYMFINLFGANGPVMAFALNYFVYCMLFVFLYKKGYLI